MTLTSNIQRVVATSLSEGYGITLPDGYDHVHEFFVSERGEHAGVPFLGDFENAEFVRQVVCHSKAWLAEGERQYVKLRHSAAEPATSLDSLVTGWGQMFRALYRGALDHVVPLENIRARITELVGCPPETKALFDILTPSDGKNCLWYHDHPVLLHLAYSQRRCSSGRWIDSYDGYDKAWLDINYISLSKDDASNVGIDPTQKGINHVLSSIGISRVLYENPGNDDDTEDAFQRVRSGLRDLSTNKTRWMRTAKNAKDELLLNLEPRRKERTESLITLIGASLQLNEEIHMRLYLGLNILRLAAQARGEVALPLTRAFTHN